MINIGLFKRFSLIDRTWHSFLDVTALALCKLGHYPRSLSSSITATTSLPSPSVKLRHYVKLCKVVCGIPFLSQECVSVSNFFFCVKLSSYSRMFFQVSLADWVIRFGAKPRLFDSECECLWMSFFSILFWFWMSWMSGFWRMNERSSAL